VAFILKRKLSQVKTNKFSQATYNSGFKRIFSLDLSYTSFFFWRIIYEFYRWLKQSSTKYYVFFFFLSRNIMYFKRNILNIFSH